MVSWSLSGIINFETHHEKTCLRDLRPGYSKPACAATETKQRLEISDKEPRGIILSKQRTTKELIRLRGYAGWSAPLIFGYCINRLSHDVAQICWTSDISLRISWRIALQFPWATSRENLFMPYANKGAYQPAHPGSLINVFVFRCLDSISLVSIGSVLAI